jgi:hypothetical protein
MDSLSPLNRKEVARWIRGDGRLFKANTITRHFKFEYSHRRVSTYENMVTEALAKLDIELKQVFIHMVTGTFTVKTPGFSCASVTPRITISIDQKYIKTRDDVNHVQISSDNKRHVFTIEQYESKHDLKRHLHAVLKSHKQNRMQWNKHSSHHLYLTQ